MALSPLASLLLKERPLPRPVRLTGFTDRTFGVELEFLFGTGSGAARNMQAVATHLRAAGLNLTSVGTYTHAVGNGWKLVPDGSVYGGAELVSPILSGADGLAQVRKASEGLVAAGCKVNRSCGFHVHHEAKDLSVANVRTLARLINRFKVVLDGLLPPSRRGAGYAMPFTTEELARLEAAKEKTCGLQQYSPRAARGEGSQTHRVCRLVSGANRSRRRVCQACACQRYRVVNLRAMHKYGTVEFRQHSGTIEAEKIVAWVALTQGLVEKAKHGRGRRTQVVANGDGFKNLLRAAGLQNCTPHGQKVGPQWVELAKDVSRYLRARAVKFGVIALADNSARRSREGRSVARAPRSARERVEAALATTPNGSAVATATATE